jgi:iron complex transport system substrate-binding protein
VRVISLVPSATETLVALGAVDELVGVTYACRLPPDIQPKPIVVKPVIDTSGMSDAEIDEAVSKAKAEGKPLYTIDYDAVKRLRPDLIVAQGLCDVCAVTPNSVNPYLRDVARVVELSPRTVSEILGDILFLGRLVGRAAEAERLVSEIVEKLEKVRSRLEGAEPVRVAFLEWVDPPYCSGHWVPELVEIAGGRDLGVKGMPSHRIGYTELIQHRPVKLIAGPCGYGLEKSYACLKSFLRNPQVGALPAVAEGDVFAVDANRFFSGHGPSIAEAVLILAVIINPDMFNNIAPEGSYKKYVVAAGR